MIIILISAVIFSNLFQVSGIIEGMKSNDHSSNKKKYNNDKHADKEHNDDDNEYTDDETHNDTETQDVIDPNEGINHEESIQNSYKVINDIIGDEGMKAMSAQTKELMKTQQALGKHLTDFEPFIKQAGALMQSFGIGKKNK